MPSCVSLGGLYPPWAGCKEEGEGDEAHLTLPLPPSVCLVMASFLLKARSALSHLRMLRLAQKARVTTPTLRGAQTQKPQLLTFQDVSGPELAPSLGAALLQCPDMQVCGTARCCTAGYGGCALGNLVDHTRPL